MEPTPPPGSGPPVPPPPPIEPPIFLPPAPLRAFTTGEVLSETFSIFFSSPVPLLVTAAVLVPLGALSLALTKALEGRPEMAAILIILRLVDSLFFSPLATGAITYAVFQRMRGRNTEVGESLRVGLSQLGSVLLVAILQGLAIIGGTLLCIIPGFIFAVMYSLAVPIAIEEKTGATQAMSRSSDLTEGNRWEIFFAMLGLIAVAFGLGIVAGVIGLIGPAVEAVMTLAVQVLASGLIATSYTVMYYRLRSVKESLDVDQIASVFD
ncbi:MAG TPA: glycerophosphoryl diester phosphodiesterase membrane domain-containing protein [Thermoanaerobaculia bacterium]|nr:glycerophosphoryl diester phosphodiesterase membrane domain-containing protein [Thermoanaerobaculia bacterium]